MAPKGFGLSPAAADALPYWREIEHAAATGLSTKGLWELIHGRAAEYGLESPGVTIFGVGQLRSRATTLQRSSRDFASLADHRSLPNKFWTQAPWARTRAEQRALPKFQVRYQHTFIKGGETITEWRTSVFETKTPRNVGALRGLVEGDAINLTKKYGTEHVGIDVLQLLIV